MRWQDFFLFWHRTHRQNPRLSLGKKRSALLLHQVIRTHVLFFFLQERTRDVPKFIVRVVSYPMDRYRSVYPGTRRATGVPGPVCATGCRSYATYTVPLLPFACLPHNGRAYILIVHARRLLYYLQPCCCYRVESGRRQTGIPFQCTAAVSRACSSWGSGAGCDPPGHFYGKC